MGYFFCEIIADTGLMGVIFNQDVFPIHKTYALFVLAYRKENISEMKTCLVLLFLCVLCLSLWHIHASVISRPGCTDWKGNFIEPGKSYFDGCNWCQCLYPQIDICTKIACIHDLSYLPRNV